VNITLDRKQSHLNPLYTIFVLAQHTEHFQIAIGQGVGNPSLREYGVRLRNTIELWKPNSLEGPGKLKERGTHGVKLVEALDNLREELILQSKISDTLWIGYKGSQ
jgi:hypothetical protein